MAAPKPRSGGPTTSLRDVSESEKLEATSSWDAIEWTKIEVGFAFCGVLGFFLGDLAVSCTTIFGLVCSICQIFGFLSAAHFAVRFACEFGLPAWSWRSRGRGASSGCLNCWILYLFPKFQSFHSFVCSRKQRLRISKVMVVENTTCFFFSYAALINFRTSVYKYFLHFEVKNINGNKNEGNRYTWLLNDSYARRK